VQEVRARFEPEASRAGCAVLVEAEPELRGHWDRLRLDQVLTNLLSNAIKYGPGKPVEIRARREDGHVLLRVTDHGMGVDPKDHERIFERFERAASERKFGGFGVGLWITRRIVHAMGGTISVTSLLGQGATFEVKLPLVAPARGLLVN
jgi:two-component system, OmpR family, sensor kinase